MERKGMTRKERRKLIRILVALSFFILVFVCGLFFSWDQKIIGVLYLLIYLLVGYDVVIKAIKNIIHGQVFDENLLMVVATFGAFYLQEFAEACAVLLFYQLGEWFQIRATNKSRQSIATLMNIRPDYANLQNATGWQAVDPSTVIVGSVIVVNPGEKIPLDGVIINGSTTLDMKALTGESLPREVVPGEQVLSGCVNLTTQIEVKVTKAFYDSTVMKILNLVENAATQKAKTENFITKFARYYTPTVVIMALLLVILPGCITGHWSTWLYRALSFLVVSCPCALVISIPLSFFAGLGTCAKCGILVKGANYLEQLAQAQTFVFDKTGTLTKGEFVVTQIIPETRKDEILRLAVLAEKDSQHPIARSIITAYGNQVLPVGYHLHNVAGAGVIATKDKEVICCGNAKLLQQEKITFTPIDAVGTTIYVAHNGQYIGAILIQDAVKPEAASVIKELNQVHGKTVMLTGDNAAVAAKVNQQLGLSAYQANLLPEDKVTAVTNLLSKQNVKEKLCFIGDGINDAPTLMRADVGIAMGGVGSDAAIEAADVVLMQDDLRGIPLAKKIAKRTMTIVKENIVFSLLIKGLILGFSALGLTNMWFAVFGDVGVTILAIFNAMRVNHKKSVPL